MNDQLNGDDFDVILDSLKNYKTKIESYGGYPSYEFKQKQLERVDSAIRKVKVLKQGLAQEK